ncbi:Protein yhjK [Klebsiella pneumoniae IS39]|nr:Protein yhjK [Klebsiella pneumoniae IS39]
MLPLSVNVSLLQLLEHDRGEEMLKLIARYRIAPGTLHPRGDGELPDGRSAGCDGPVAPAARGRGCRLRWMILAWVMPGCTSYSR